MWGAPASGVFMASLWGEARRASSSSSVLAKIGKRETTSCKKSTVWLYFYINTCSWHWCVFLMTRQLVADTCSCLVNSTVLPHASLVWSQPARSMVCAGCKQKEEWTREPIAFVFAKLYGLQSSHVYWMRLMTLSTTLAWCATDCYSYRSWLLTLNMYLYPTIDAYSHTRLLIFAYIFGT